MGRPGGKNKGRVESVEALQTLERDAARALGGRRGPAERPGDTGTDSGSAVPASGDGGLPAGTGKAPSGVTLDAARGLHGQVVDALHGYHELGYAVTGHDHWRSIKDERRERAAFGLARLIERLPPDKQAMVLVALAWSSVGVVGFEMLGAPVVESLKLNRKEKTEAKAKKEKEQEAARRGAEQ